MTVQAETQPYAPMRFSTEGLPPTARFDVWREAFALRAARLEVTMSDMAAFQHRVRPSCCQSFRRRYGISPSDVRMRARHQ